MSDFALRDMWGDALSELDEVRLFGDLAVLAFFSSEKPKHREAKRAEFVAAITNGGASQYRWLIQQARWGIRLSPRFTGPSNFLKCSSAKTRVSTP